MGVSENAAGGESKPSEAVPPEKKPWVTPRATVEQVSNATRNNLGLGGDLVSCHS